jgi:protein-S-isoprenylcysteine O-methyltransferase Ste14
LAYLKKPDGASLLAVRTDAIGWLGGGVFLAGLAFHVWSNVSLARGERQGSAEASASLVTDGPFRYVRNPIYVAGITLLLGVGLLYSTWSAVDLVLPLLLLVFFHLRVVRAEEPALRRRFGSKYEEYCRRVPRWFPVPTSRARADQRGGAAGDPSRHS